MSEVKYCTDCKHYSGRCYRKVSYNTDVVIKDDNVMKGVSLHPWDERYSILPWKCGKKARYFEPK